MVKLDFVIICDNAFTTEGTGSLNILGTFDRIIAERFPAVHSKFVIVTRISGEVGSYNQLIVIKDKTTGEEIAKLSKQLEIIRKRAQFIGNFINILFKLPGEYEIEVYINNQLQNLTTSFYVEQSK